MFTDLILCYTMGIKAAYKIEMQKLKETIFIPKILVAHLVHPNFQIIVHKPGKTKLEILYKPGIDSQI